MWWRWRGMTFVEVMVVVAIMLILMSILLPAACKLARVVHGLTGR